MKIPATRITPLLWLLGLLLMGGVVACSDSQSPAATSQPAATSTVAAPGMTVLTGSTDLAVGENRLVFAVLDEAGEMVRRDIVDITLSHVDGSVATERGRTKATFREWPLGRGIYVAKVFFDEPGAWLLDVGSESLGREGDARALLQVAETSVSPALGSLAPRSQNKTMDDVLDLAELTTDPTPDEDLYRLTIAEALDLGKPLVVTFATPAFCQSATCGPQVDVVEGVKAAFAPNVSFIHVEVFDNPLEIEGDLSKARLSPILEEWRLQTEPFTFVVDAGGKVSAKFEGFVTEDELVLAILAVLS